MAFLLLELKRPHRQNAKMARWLKQGQDCDVEQIFKIKQKYGEFFQKSDL